jgi:NAD(P)-dependent dehydrogenase (short-subunit alcohol dehydrogenase family)
VAHTPVSPEVTRAESWRRHGFGLDAASRARIDQRAFWVTGAGSGFGRAVATALAVLGARVIVTGRNCRKLEETRATAEDLGADGAAIVLLPADLRDPLPPDAIAALRDAGVEGLVHCAAVGTPRQNAPLLEDTVLPAVLASNVLAAWHAGQAAVQVSVDRRRVRLVFFTSEAAWHFTAGVGPYNISKAALNSLASSLACEAAAHYPACDVQINTLNPGEARTEMNQGSDRSPYTAVPITLALLAHAEGGPNGRFFHADGRHLQFATAAAWPVPLLGTAAASA